jgi:hypothetical protein
MEIKEYAQLVQSMREAQKNFFRSRYSHDLKESKRIEKDVDKATDEILNLKPVDNQKKLF